MAANGVRFMSLTVIHGPKKYDIKLELPDNEAGDALCVRHLSAAVTNVTSIPQQAQRLIHKGKSLKNQDDELAELGLKNGSKVMLVGKKAVPEDDEATRTLNDLEKKLETQAKKLSDITYELDGIHRGYLNAQQQGDVVRQKEKHMALLAEHLMKMLEQLDAIKFAEEDTSGRGKRKSLVNQIQTLLTRIDGLSRGVSDMLARWNLL